MEKEVPVKSVGRALEIIHIVSTYKDGIGVTELAKKMKINKSSVYRILLTLAEFGYIEQDQETERYKLGYKFLEISAKLLDSIDIRKEALPYLLQLERLTNEVIHLAVWDQGEVVYIEKLEGNETLRMHSRVGKRAPMHCTSVGKAILAHLPREVVLEVMERKGLPVHTKNTIVDKEKFLEELDKIKERGFALDLEENEEGITCISVPIFDHLGKVLASISISGPTMRMTKERLENLRPVMLDIGKKLSKRLGYRGNNI